MFAVICIILPGFWTDSNVEGKKGSLRSSVGKDILLKLAVKLWQGKIRGIITHNMCQRELVPFCNRSSSLGQSQVVASDSEDQHPSTCLGDDLHCNDFNVEPRSTAETLGYVIVASPAIPTYQRTHRGRGVNPGIYPRSSENNL